ncbi:MAG: alpha/beta hydrolase [Candidatus Pacebacteria bacterium]|nr:alpha/beta hydrolase [Candidatus Paceibacterota bacterium]
MKNKQQVLIIHGGTPYEDRGDYVDVLRNKTTKLEWIEQKRDWKNNLYQDLGEDFVVYSPQMPNKQTAKYSEWKVVFEKLLNSVREEVILVGYSLGALFLVKYLSEENISKKIKKTLLLGTPFDQEGMDNEPLLSFARVGSLEKFAKQSGDIYFYHSEDDFVVPFDHLAKYESELPEATFRSFTDRNHFKLESMNELIQDIKS